MSPKLNRQMALVLDDLEFRADVGVLVLTGNGGAFTAGMDLQEYFRDNEAKGLPAIRAAQRESYGWWRRLRWFQKPTIAMVNGWCFGGGYGPFFACDLAFAAEEAQFGLSEINWGILPGGCATKIARELLSFRRAMYHALTGETIDGLKAAAWGLVNEAVPLEKLGGARRAGLPDSVTEEPGCAESHQGRHSPGGRDDLRQRRGLPRPRAGSGQFLRQRRSQASDEAVSG